MKFNYKSRKGFTLIELLVVIGILAVLAAIAIPSVAGLIDRANVSADNTNANEYTNAIERFTSEYELYCQDIASGIVKDENDDGKPDGDLDSAQGRVYNVTGAVTRADITALESAGHGDKQINRDTKYPVNTKTLESIIVNYTKTSSATFEPKQSDCSFWYNSDCGVVVVAKTNASYDDLNKLIASGMDANGNSIEGNENWTNTTTSHSPEIPQCLHQNTEVSNVKEPTGIETGYTGDIYCKDCNTIIQSGNMIPILECWTSNAGLHYHNGLLFSGFCNTNWYEDGYWVSGCFVAGTKVLMSNGTEKNIEDMQIGDKVVSYNRKTGEFYNVIVTQTMKDEITNAYFDVTLENGITIGLTGDHPILTNKGYECIFGKSDEALICDALDVGDKVFTVNGYQTVVAIVKHEKKTKVYNLSVADDDEIKSGEDNDEDDIYIVNGIAAHNRTHGGGSN